MRLGLLLLLTMALGIVLGLLIGCSGISCIPERLGN